MEWWHACQALILGIVEGLTEFLPISSTGHQIIVADLLGFGGKRFKAFNIIIQSGAILAVMWEYRRKLGEVVRGLRTEKPAQRFTANLIIAFIPAVIAGLAFAGIIQKLLFNPITVAVALVVGGLIMLWAEKREHVARIHEVDKIGRMDALTIGCAQCLALIPGTSRSGATIIGGLLIGLSRKTATEFSFFLAIPTITGATVYSIYHYYAQFQGDGLWMLTIGFTASFFSALLAVRSLLRFIGKHSYVAFAWYRIVFGSLILLTWQLGWISWTAAG